MTSDTRDPGSEVFVESAARLHFGVLDLRGDGGRWFGGIGAAAPSPTVMVSASCADLLIVEGDDSERAALFAQRFLSASGIAGGAHIRVHRALPRHAGLGSGTQLALCVARSLAELYGVSPDAAALARAVGRAKRSAIGTWTFAGGGLVLEGGRKRENEAGGPLLARIAFPSSWRCVVAIPASAPGVSGADEDDAFARLEPPSARDVEHVAHVVLMSLLPALVEGDLPTFGAALNRVQTVTGRWWAPAQGGVFAAGPSSELIRQMTAWGAAGVGQSSWGPTVYGIVEGLEAGAALAEQVRGFLGPGGRVFEGPFRNDGATVTRRGT
jgi:beta-RFAP synthase